MTLRLKSGNVFYADPASGRTVTFTQFATDLVSAASEMDSHYSTICQLILNIARGNHFCLEDGRVELSAGSEFCDKTIDGNLLSAIRESKSQIRLLTSGTTGAPKCVVHSVSSLTRGVRTGKHHQYDIWGLTYPLDRLAGLQVLFQALFNKNTIVQLFGLPFRDVHRAIEKHQITHLSSTPTFLKLVASQAHIHLNVKHVTTGGERCDKTTRSTVKRLFPNAKYRNIYALTEVGNLLITNGNLFVVPPELRGKVIVVDGCLAIHQSLLADSQILSSIKSVPNESLPDGESKSQNYYLTGDRVDIVEDQPLTFNFSARHDDIINVGGFKVTPQQVEDCLVQLPGIQSAAVYGKSNSVTGQIVICDVVIEPEALFDSEDAKRKLSEILPRHAIPRIFNIVEKLRVTRSGKLCRRNEPS